MTLVRAHQGQLAQGWELLRPTEVPPEAMGSTGSTEPLGRAHAWLRGGPRQLAFTNGLPVFADVGFVLPSSDFGEMLEGQERCVFADRGGHQGR